MHIGSPRWLRLPRRTARLRLTILYGAAFLASGVVVLGLTYLLDGGTVHITGGTISPVLRQVASGRVLAADVHREGRFDVFNINVPLTSQQAKAASSALNLAQIGADRQTLLIDSAIALAVFALAAAALGWLLAGRVLRPLSTITATARRISASSLHERLALHGPDDELKELADTLDGLFARLEASFETQRRFAANASHELLTPLTRERTLLQVTSTDPDATTATWQAVSRELLASNAEQETLIEALLTLASSEAGTSDREPVDLAAITGAAMAVPRPMIGRLALDVHTDLRPAALDGDPQLIQRLAANLIDNAVRHNVHGGDIQVTTTASDAGAILSVINSGPVIPDADVDRLFQPFQRFGPRPSRRDGGHGLGLSIVKAIASAHGATVTARPRPAGGLTIDVTFPPPAAPQTDRSPGEAVHYSRG
jgi:signal transduction histidine kinase